MFKLVQLAKRNWKITYFFGGRPRRFGVGILAGPGSGSGELSDMKRRRLSFGGGGSEAMFSS
jgi:hypothetical protein